MDWCGSPTAVTGWPPPNSGAQQHELGMAGVLVLVEQDDARPGPLRRADLRHLLGDPGRERHLVAEVQRSGVALALGVAPQQRHELRTLRERLQGALDLRVGTAGLPARIGLGQGPHPALHLLGQLGDLGRVDEVLRALRGQREHGVHDGRRGLRQPTEVAVPRLDDAVRQLPAGCLARAAGNAGSTPTRRPWSPTTEAA